MNFLDILLILAVAVFTLRGLLRGLIREAFTLIAVAAGFYLANSYYALPAPLLEPVFSGATNVKAAGYLLVFILTLIAVLIVYRLLKMCVTLSLTRWVDYTAGAIFGLLEGAAITSFLVILMMNFMPSAQFLKNSKLVPEILTGAVYVLNQTPPSFRKVMDQAGLTLPGLAPHQDAGADQTNSPESPDSTPQDQGGPASE